MSWTIIDNPDPVDVEKWGPLGHVSKSDREAILNLGFGLFKPAVKAIEKQLEERKKKEKKKLSENKLRDIRRYSGGAV